jgi:hypothetical protein
MDEPKRKGLEALKESLILAAEDMQQAHRAATAMREDTSNDEAWRRSLETSMAVCYMRPFTKGAWKLPSKYVPNVEPNKAVHEGLHALRNKVYAHSDQASGRRATMTTKATNGDLVTIEYETAWLQFPLRKFTPSKRCATTVDTGF